MSQIQTYRGSYAKCADCLEPLNCGDRYVSHFNKIHCRHCMKVCVYCNDTNIHVLENLLLKEYDEIDARYEDHNYGR